VESGPRVGDPTSSGATSEDPHGGGGVAPVKKKVVISIAMAIYKEA
jgi:hypothetical protein